MASASENGQPKHHRNVLDCLQHVLTAVEAIDEREVNFNNDDFKRMEVMLGDVMRHVKRLHNASLAAIRLPPEILQDIFRTAQDHLLMPRCREYGSVVYEDRCPYRWLSYGQVCRYWRNVALSFPSLWSTLCMGGYGAKRPCLQHKHMLHPTLLQRAADNPLSISVLHGVTAELSAVIDLLSRTRELYLVGEFSMVHLNALSVPAPHLQTFVVRGSAFETASFDLALPKAIFGGTWPPLRSFALSCVNVYPIGDFSHLRQLEVSDVEFKRGSYNSFVTFVGSAPLLEDLMLRRVQTMEFPWEPYTGPRTPMPALKRLFFEQCKGTFRLLSRLILPSGVSQIHSDEEKVDAVGLIPRDLSHLDNLTDLTRFELSFASRDNEVEVFAVGDTSAFRAGAWSLGGWGGPVDAAGSYAIETIAALMHRAEEVWFTARTALPTKSRLRLTRYRAGAVPDAMVHRYRDAIASLLRAAPFARKVALFTKAEWLRLACLEALFPSRSTDDHDPQFPCPNLSELHVYNPTGTLHETLHRLLKERNSQDCPVTKLVAYFVPQEPERDVTESLAVWRATAYVELSAYVDQIEVVEVPHSGLPRMTLVPACTSQSGGVWNWPLWEDRNLDEL